MKNVWITGDPDKLVPLLPTTIGNESVCWKVLSVLKFERVEVSEEILCANLERLDWAIFTSPRCITFWNELLLQHHFEMPAQTRIAVIGKTTGDTALHEGWEVDFVPDGVGSEAFLKEFCPWVNLPARMVMPGSVLAREFIASALRKMNHHVSMLPIYRSIEAIEKLELNFDACDLLVVTSPSSFEAIDIKYPGLATHTRVATLGSFTADHLRKKGIEAEILDGLKGLGGIL